jgi:hypothetical protein
MVTRLHGTLKRELPIRGRAYVVTLDEAGIKLTVKGRRKGQQMLWNDIVSGDAALAVALNASLTQANDEPQALAPPDPLQHRKPVRASKGKPARRRAVR